jgi:hypothetical protein
VNGSELSKPFASHSRQVRRLGEIGEIGETLNIKGYERLNGLISAI